MEKFYKEIRNATNQMDIQQQQMSGISSNLNINNNILNLEMQCYIGIGDSKDMEAPPKLDFSNGKVRKSKKKFIEQEVRYDYKKLQRSGFKVI